MLFNSIAFMFFFPITVLLYFFIPGRFRYIWLLAADYIFYLSQDGGMAGFIAFSTVLTWVTGGILYDHGGGRRKNVLLFISLLANFLPLLLLKYTGRTVGLPGGLRLSDPLIPAGISFYTLQSATYVISCFKREIRPERSFLKYALFVSFFPCILSGPIERAADFLPQTDRDGHGFDPLRVKEGLMELLWGYFLKLVIVSRLSILTDLVYSEYEALSGTAVLFGVIAYSFQIYCDFAGYSHIAFGAARILGYNIICNFRQPYFASSVQDFWRRWHISLSTWFRDYLYIPLGGNRRGRLRQYVNLMTVFIVSGLWHGADLTFIVWGGLYGLYQVLSLIIRRAAAGPSGKGEDGRGRAAGKLLRIIITYVIVMLTWIPFRAESLTEAAGVFLRLFSDNSPVHLIDGTLFRLGLGVNNLLFAVFALLIVLAVDLSCERRGCMIYELLDNVRRPFRFGFYYLLVILILFSANLSTQEFLYQGF